MYLVAGFESGAYVEMALSELEESEISQKGIVTIGMEAQKAAQTLFDSIHYSDGVSVLDGMAAWAVVFAVFGIVFGSQVKIGPLALGLAGYGAGALFGFLLDMIRQPARGKAKASRTIEIILLIPCESKQQMNLAASICTKYKVVSLGQHSV